jgi:hypothetical protein
MSVSFAVDHPHRSDARPGSLASGSFREDGSPQDNSQQPPALFRRPIALAAPVDSRPPATRRPAAIPAAAGRNVPGTPGGAAARSRSQATSLPVVAQHGGARQRASRVGGGRQPLVRSAPVPQAARDLLTDATRGLGNAMSATTVADRYAAAHLAALRAAAAVLAARARPVRGRRGSAWELISKVAPEFAEWAAFFAAGSSKRQAAEAGIQRLVSPRDADDMVRQVAAFLDLVEESLNTG